MVRTSFIIVVELQICRSRLAGDDGASISIDGACNAAIASKPAPAELAL
jgi:hypothetical protein